MALSASTAFRSPTPRRIGWAKTTRCGCDSRRQGAQRSRKPKRRCCGGSKPGPLEVRCSPTRCAATTACSSEVVNFAVSRRTAPTSPIGSSPGFRGEGYAARALILLVQAACAIRGLQSLEAHIDVDNIASRNTASRAGFVAMGTVVDVSEKGAPVERLLYICSTSGSV